MSSSSNDLYYVGIGSSAGGLSALKEFFHNIPRGIKACFIVAQHLSPNYKSNLTEILERVNMPLDVQVLERSISPEAGTIYVTPPNHDVIIQGNKIVLSETSGHGPKPSVDRLFTTLGESVKNRSIAIVFSGTGSDGAKGALKVHECGGIVIIQDPDDAEHNGMPLSTRKTDVVDFIMPAGEMGRKLYDLTKNPPPSITRLSDEEYQVRQQLKKLYRSIHQQFGVNLGDYKETTITRRLQRRMAATGYLDLGDYLAFALKKPEEQSEFYHDMIISVTEYFRDSEAFKAVNKVIEQLVQEKGKDEQYRVWVPGCATGEEAYSLACLFGEALGGIEPLKSKQLQIFATDIDQKALSQARKGVYDASNLYAISQRVKDKYFVGHGETFQVRKELRDCILFNRHNIIENPPFKRIDLVSCRNLLIYLQPEVQSKLINLFHYSLNENGILFLGKSENISRHEDNFDPIDKTNRIFRKREGYTTPPSTFSSPMALKNGNYGGDTSINERKRLDNLFDNMISTLAPNSILIDDQFYIKKIFGEADSYLSIGQGNFSANVTELLASDLRSIVQVLIMKVQRNKVPTVNNILRKDGEVDMYTVKVTVRPMKDANGRDGLILISFEKESLELTPDLEHVEANEEGVKQLHEELNSLREHLRNVVEELESSNEELQLSNEEMQSSNEELQSANEELETTNQELQSTNEELSTVNDELSSKTYELEKQTAELEQLVNSLNFPVFRINSEFQVKRYNSAAQKVFAIRKNYSESLPLFVLLPQEINFDNLRKRIKEALEKGKTIEEEIVFNHRHYEMILQPITRKNKREDDEILLLFKDRTEITIERNRVMNSERRLKSIVDNTTTPIYIKDVSGRYTLVNSAFLELFGLKDEEVIGKKDKDLFAEEVAKAVSQNDLVTLQEESVRQLEEVVYDKNGEKQTFVSVKFPLYDEDDEVIALCGISTNITQKAIFENHLRMYQRILTSMKDMLLVTEMRDESEGEYYVTYANPAFLNITGYKEDEIRNLPITKILPLFSFHNATGYRDLPKEMTLVDRDGKEVMVERQIVNVDTDALNGKPTMAVIIRDISIRKKHENRLLEEKVAAEAANVAKSAFLANMSHEIRTPMSAIHGITNILTKMEVEEDRRQKLLDTLKTSSDRLLHLINDILDYAKMEAGQLTLEITDFDFYQEMNQQMEMASASGNNKNLEFLLDVDPSLPRMFMGDPLRISQILQNLLSNAIKFTEKGSISLTARSKGTKDGDHWVEIRVKDTGIGISKDQKGLIFEKFSQADVSTSRKFGGTGLGLAIVKELLSLMNGTIDVESSLGNGSTFIITLPLAPSLQSEPEHSSLYLIEEDLSPIFTDIQEAAKYPILVVEDQLTNVTVMEHYLKNLGCRYDIAMNGKSGLQKVLRKDFALLLLDIQMNEMDGFELTQIIRMLPDENKRKVPIVGVTAHVHAEYHQMSRKAGMDGYISKPVEPGVLKAHILKHLNLEQPAENPEGEE